MRPIGEAAPFIKDLAPYAGIAAGAMMGNPYVGGAVGGIASGFGKPGGFDFKRAFMGGVASYGMSNLMSGLEAAGTPESALPFIQKLQFSHLVLWVVILCLHHKALLRRLYNLWQKQT